MSTSVSKAFVRQYQADVHLAYQRQGSRLRNTVRTQTDIEGASTVFQKLGKGEASEKSRHGLVPPMNPEHSTVECFLKDYYAGDYVDKLDEKKIKHAEQQVLSQTGAFALGRKTDSLIVEAALATSRQALDGSTGMTKAKAKKMMVMLGDADVPDDGDRFVWVGWEQWSELLDIDEFAKADYVGAENLPWPKLEAKRWLGSMWAPYSGLPLVGGVRRCIAYHKSALGHAIGQDVTAEINYIGDRASHFVNNIMSQGAVLIDGDGVIELPCKEA